jgi:tRNA(fMet)-specific endonuclease VapC
MYLLDTDHISILQKQTQPEFARLARRMGQHAPTDFFAPVVSFHEQALGANAYIQQARTVADVVRGYETFQQILADFAAAQVLPFDQTAAMIFANLRALKVRIATMDLRIAAIALANNKTVLTRNTRDFLQVLGLNVEDWTT